MKQIKIHDQNFFLFNLYKESIKIVILVLQL